MEIIWCNLSENYEFVESPSWYEQLLNEIDNRFKAGQEKLIDWQVAKQNLLSLNS